MIIPFSRVAYQASFWKPFGSALGSFAIRFAVKVPVSAERIGRLHI
jgi:hypothetical protein